MPTLKARQGNRKQKLRAQQEDYLQEQADPNALSADYFNKKYGKYMDMGGTQNEPVGLDYRAQLAMAKAQQKKSKGQNQKRRAAMASSDDMTADLEEYSTDEEDDPREKRGGAAKRHQKGDTKQGNKMKRYKTTCERIGKLLFLTSAVLLISVSALRFTVVDMQSMHEAIMNFYFLFFGVVLALQQLGIRYIKRNFRFLNYHWGKSLFCMFIAFASLSNSQNQILQYVSAALFFILTILYGVLAGWDRKSDNDRSEKDEVDLQEYLVKQQFKADPAMFYIDSLKQKQKEAKETYNGVKKAANIVQGFQKTVAYSPYQAGPQPYLEPEDSKMYTPDDEHSFVTTTPPSGFQQYQKKAQNIHMQF